MLLRISLGEATKMVLAVWALVCVALVFQIFRSPGESTDWSRIAGVLAVGVAFSAGLAWLLREAYRVRIEPDGVAMGWSKGLVPWREITSVSAERMPLGKHGLAVRATNHPTVVILNSIALTAAFSVK